MAAKMGFDETPPRRKYGNRPVSVEIDGKMFHFRSKAEYDVAEYLHLLKQSGYIKDFAYEQTKFCFPSEAEPIKTWLLDFDILENDGSFYYIEVKGRVEPDTKSKLKLLNTYRPEVRVDMVFTTRRELNRLGSRATSYCRRVCLLSDLTGGMI